MIEKIYIMTAIVFASCLMLTSCTFNVSMVHTEGQASDVIDETSTNAPTVSPQIEIPLPKV